LLSVKKFFAASVNPVPQLLARTDAFCFNLLGLMVGCDYLVAQALDSLLLTVRSYDDQRAFELMSK
jgi:hypothetical protein